MKEQKVEYNGQEVYIHPGEAAIVNEWGGLRTVPTSYLRDPQFMARVRSIEAKMEVEKIEDGLEKLDIGQLKEKLLSLQIAMPMGASREVLLRTLREEIQRRTPSRTTVEDREKKSAVSEWHEMKAHAKMLAEQNGVDLPKKQDKETLKKFIDKLNK